MRRSPLPSIALGWLLGFAGPGCQATLDEQPAAMAVVPAAPTLHRLTKSQYQATVRALFGEAIKVPTDLEADTPLHGFASIGASELTIPPRAAEQYEAAALDVAHQAWSNAALRKTLLGPGCAPTTVGDPCLRGFLSRFGRQAFRRPLTTEETDRLLALAGKLTGDLGSLDTALEYTLSSFLQSPHFLFRVEIGEPDPDRPDRLRYTSYEMASRLSFLLWNGPPDADLLDAAERGELVTGPGLRAQTERLLAAPAARASIGSFFGEYFNLARLDSMTKDKALFPQLTPTLVAAMREEILRDVQDVVFTRAADYRELFSGGGTFVNAELAALYGLPAPAGGPGYSRIELPADSKRGGLLGTAGILALNAHATTTSPTHRGKFVRGYLLCQDIPPPPAGVVTTLEPPSGMKKTLRQRLEQHRQDPACRSCHQMMDPIGLGLEHFDAIGAFRTVDEGLPIDASADLDGVPFEGAAGLGRALAADPRLSECLARQFYRHATGHLEEAAEQQGISQLGTAFAETEYRFQQLVLRLVASDGFRLASPPAPEGGV
jgi:hypothetical protein